MSRKPRDTRVDIMVTPMLICHSYCQVGAILAIGAMFAY